MDTALETPRQARPKLPSLNEAWDLVVSQLRLEMSGANYSTWVEPLKPLSYKEGVFRVGVINQYGRDWVAQRLSTRIEKLLEVAYQQPVRINLTTWNPDEAKEVPAPPVKEKRAPNGSTVERKQAADELDPAVEGGSPRKIQLQRAYGTERARIIQPERGMFITMYFFSQWLPLVGHSAMAVVMAARALCYWNVKTGEMRNVIETDMSEIAKRASVSVRTVKDVLNTPLIKDYFLRYKVRRVMTTNGVRTAGIVLFVRMDDPLTPEDQDTHQLVEESTWYTAEFSDDSD